MLASFPFVTSFRVVAEDDKLASDDVGWGDSKAVVFEDDTADEGADIEYIPREVLESIVVITS